MSSIKKNFLYSTILTISNYLFPLLTYPYVSRVLGVTNIGICNYIDSIVHYFVLFAMMGTTFLGIREIASNKSDKDRLNASFSSIIILNVVTTLIGLIVLLYLMFFVDKFEPYRSMLTIGILKLLGTVFTIDWFYKGREDFKFITQRTIIVKILYSISIFVFIHDIDDYKTYFFLTTMMFVVNTIINCWHAKIYVSLTWKGINLKKLYKPFLILGLQAILTSMYTSFNVAYLGYITNPTEVGYYTTATKLFTLILSVYTAFTGVMIPRMSFLVAEKKINEFKSMLNKSLDVLFGISIPLIIFFEIFSSDVILIIAGHGYEGAILPSRIIMPLILIIGYEQILVIQTLMPLKADKELFWISVMGAIFGIIMNVALVNQMGSKGSAIVWLTSEFFVLIMAQHYVTKKLNITFPYQTLFKQILCYIPFLVISMVVYFYCNSINYFAKLGIMCLILCLYIFFTQVYIIKNPTFQSIKEKLATRFNKNN